MGLARTFQNTRLFSSMTVLENVLVVNHATGFPWRFDARKRMRALEILEFVGLSNVGNRDAKSLPQGQRRLLEIAKALAVEPRVICSMSLTAASTRRKQIDSSRSLRLCARMV